MLVSECARIVLQAEHARIRELLGSIGAALEADEWTYRGVQAGLLELIERSRRLKQRIARNASFCWRCPVASL